MTAEQISQTIKDLAPILLPLLPYLVKSVKLFGSGMIKSAGEKAGEGIPDDIKKIWQKLAPKVKKTPGAQKIVDKIIENPKDQRAIAAFELVLEDILKDESLRKELADLLRQSKEKGITVEQITDVDSISGKITSVDVEDAGSLQQADIKSKLKADRIEKGGVAVGVRLGSKKN